MNFEKRLDQLLRAQDIQHACEVGVYKPENSKILPLAQQGLRCTFVEPENEAFGSLQKAVGHLQNVRLVNAAIASARGSVTLVRAGESTYLEGLKSPAIVNDALEEHSASTQIAQGVLFDEVDDGSIDYLRVDVEGAEWYVIENLVSRPDIIVLELHGKRYLNPHLKELKAWLSAHGYVPLYIDKSDVVFVKKDRYRTSILDVVLYRLGLARIFLRLIRTRITAYLLSGLS